MPGPCAGTGKPAFQSQVERDFSWLSYSLSGSQKSAQRVLLPASTLRDRHLRAFQLENNKRLENAIEPVVHDLEGPFHLLKREGMGRHERRINALHLQQAQKERLARPIYHACQTYLAAISSQEHHCSFHREHRSVRSQNHHGMGDHSHNFLPISLRSLAEEQKRKRTISSAPGREGVRGL